MHYVGKAITCQQCNNEAQKRYKATANGRLTQAKRRQSQAHKDARKRQPSYGRMSEAQKVKHVARQAVSNALAAGTLLKDPCCARCGSMRHMQAHHFMGYEAQHHLTVVWLCAPCHGRAHRIVPHDVASGMTERQRRRIMSAYLAMPVDKRDVFVSA